MRITDLPVTPPVSAARAPGTRRAEVDSHASPLASLAREPGHPDEVAAAALSRAAGLAHAGRAVAAANEHAASSVRGDRLDEALVP